MKSTLLLTLGLAIGTAAHAQTSFNFTILNASYPQDTLYGEITVNAAGTQLSSAELTTIPAIFDAAYDVGFNFASYTVENSVTLTGGQITSLEFYGVNTATTYDDTLTLNDTDYFQGNSFQSRVSYFGPSGISGLDLTPVVVPEPTSLALAGLGGAALWLFRKRK